MERGKVKREKGKEPEKEKIRGKGKEEKDKKKEVEKEKIKEKEKERGREEKSKSKEEKRKGWETEKGKEQFTEKEEKEEDNSTLAKPPLELLVREGCLRPSPKAVVGVLAGAPALAPVGVRSRVRALHPRMERVCQAANAISPAPCPLSPLTPTLRPRSRSSVEEGQVSSGLVLKRKP